MRLAAVSLLLVFAPTATFAQVGLQPLPLAAQRPLAAPLFLNPLRPSATVVRPTALVAPAVTIRQPAMTTVTPPLTGPVCMPGARASVTIDPDLLKSAPAGTFTMLVAPAPACVTLVPQAR